MLSGAVHAAVVVLIALLVFVRWPQRELIEFEVIENPKVASPTMNLTPPQQAQPEPPPPEPETRKVFGASRKALRDESLEASVPEIKAGNTVATEPDNEKLTDDDAGSLPLPTDEYLVSEMPSLLAEIRIPYPPEARAAQIEGKVTLDVLIDQQGVVRDAKLVSGPGYGLNEAALAAVKQFQFKPARVGEQAVAVRTRFIYNFVLER